MFASITSATTTGVLGQPIRVEVHTSSGFPGFTVVGMPDVAMKESKERVRAAMSSSGLKWPESRITINLAPATIRKTGTGCELATLVGLLVCSKILEAKRFENVGVIGELGLDGTIREVPGTIARVLALRDSGIEEVFVPSTNAYEASLVSGIKIFPIDHTYRIISSNMTRKIIHFRRFDKGRCLDLIGCHSRIIAISRFIITISSFIITISSFIITISSFW